MSGKIMSSHEAIAAATRRNPHLVNAREALTPFDVFAAQEERDYDAEERAIRGEAIAKMIEWLMEGGIDLDRAMKRLLVLVRAYRPELLRNMSGAEIGALFGQTRAAESIRARKVTEATLKKAGYRCTALPYQKSETTRQKCAAAQRGNHNRAKKAA